MNSGTEGAVPRDSPSVGLPRVTIPQNQAANPFSPCRRRKRESTGSQCQDGASSLFDSRAAVADWLCLLQAAFTAINVEAEEDIDEEIDTTKELQVCPAPRCRPFALPVSDRLLQVEDALKLFQTALKLHAQGPRFFDQASDAYDALFESEIFKYPESKTDYERSEAGQDGALALEPAFLPGLDVVGAEVDGIGSSLPQALFLSYKNHGLFVMDRIRHKARSLPAPKDALLQDPAVQADAHRALYDFCAALDRDPSDAELWRKAARVAAFLTSARISRYSLEAAIEMDDDPAVDEVLPPSLAEGLAGEQLKHQLQILGDEMALTHPIMKPFLEKEMPSGLTRYLDPLPFLPDPTTRLAIPRPDAADTETPRLVVSLAAFSWAELGASLVRIATEDGLSGRAVSIQLPDASGEQDVQMEVDLQLMQPSEPSSPLEDKQPAAGQAAGAAAEQSADGDTAVAEPKSAATEVSPVDDQPARERNASMTSRKRSQSVAGIPDAHDDENADLKRSKRTRRRDTAVEETMDSATFLATQLQPLQAADQNLFQTTKNLLENLGVTDRITLDRIDEILDSCASDDRTGKIQTQATVDLRDSLMHFEEDTATVLLSKRELPQLSLSAFLEHAKSGSQRARESPLFDNAEGLRQFVETANGSWNTIHDVAYEYVRNVSKSYTESKWSDGLKTAVAQLVDTLDGSIYDRVIYEAQLLRSNLQSDASAELPGIVQMLLELHVAAYEQATDPNSEVAQEARLETRDRLDRWMALAGEITRLRNPDPDDALSLRFLWAAVSATTLVKGAPRDHVLSLWHSLRDNLAAVGADISLPNNAAMPEISTAAAEREISKLTTMDFFLGLFQEDAGDPVSVIESLEPVLNPEAVHISVPVSHEPDAADDEAARPKQRKQPIVECASQELLDLWKFLKSSNTELRLLLWSRLGEAYGKIQYTTKQFSCFLRSIETIVADLEGDEYVNSPAEPRKALFMSMLKALDDLVIQALHLALNDNSSFDIIDEDHLRSSMAALAKVSCLLHVAAMYEDEMRIGMVAAPPSGSTLRSFLNRLQEMQVRAWSLQYTMLKVGINQHPDIFPNPENDLADYLAAVHQVLGLRKCCRASNKVFLKMMRVELLKQRNIENWEDYLGQVLYDLHGLKLGVGIWDVQDHGCEPEDLQKRQALQLVEKVTMLANRMSMKDLLKSDLKTTIERMQQAIGSAKSTPQMTHNLRNYSEYLKSPIHPLHLYQALTGSVDLDAVSINTPDSAPAKHGWFFLLGMIALTKFKSVDLNRRQTPGATDDLRIGATFLRLQLQYTPDRWGAWFRLAECFDYELDESVLWTADKMNKERAELVKFQRQAIHSYIMALSHSYAWASDPSALTSLEEDEEALYDMYHEFGMRMYSSSREPFAMEAFRHADHKRFFIEAEGSGTYKKVLHNEMTDYQVWKFAAHLFRKAMVGRPKDWKNPYMVAKCLWKMYQKPPEELDEKNRRRQPSVQAVVDALEKTVEVVSELPKPRHGQDPILEPHYKILSVVHKLVMRGDLTVQEGAKILQRQPYAPDRGREVAVDNMDDWEAYVIRCLRYLRDKDKSNWQHRLIMRHARVLFDEDATDGDSGSYVAAKAAFTVLRESMFTKTMVMNVWKCDAERPGRHHVYTERYIRYVVKLLDVMNDRANLEALLRRIRKKGADFYHFNELWQFCVLTYVKLLRQTFRVPAAEEDVFKSLTQEEFDVVGEKITQWATTADAEGNGALNAMKEAVELKKLNANLMKAGPIDDLITDCYSAIYLHVRPELPEQEGPSRDPTGDDSSQHKDAGPQADEGAEQFKSKLLQGLLSRDSRDQPTAVLGALRGAATNSDRDNKSERTSAAGEPAPRVSRAVGGGGGIRRPNILRKAEQAVQAVLRAAEGGGSGGAPRSGGANGANGATGASKSRVGSISSARNGGRTPRGESHGSSDEDSDGDVEMRDADGHAGGHGSRRRHSAAAAAGAASARGGDGGGDDNGSEISSPPGSVHDSADDESDLSDVPADYEDDAPPSLLFPNLGRSMDMEESAAASESGAGGGDADSSSSDGGEDDEEEREEGDEGGGGGGDGDGDSGADDQAREQDSDEHGDDEETEVEETRDEDGDGDGNEDGDGDETVSHVSPRAKGEEDR